MLALVVRRIVLVLTGLAFLGGATVQAMPSSMLIGAPVAIQGAASHDGDFAGMSMHGPTKPSKSAPCETVNLDCIKSMGCIGSPTLPPRSGSIAAPVQYGSVTYWAVSSVQTGLTTEPDLFPPITV